MDYNTDVEPTRPVPGVRQPNKSTTRRHICDEDHDRRHRPETRPTRAWLYFASADPPRWRARSSHLASRRHREQRRRPRHITCEVHFQNQRRTEMNNAKALGNPLRSASWKACLLPPRYRDSHVTGDTACSRVRAMCSNITSAAKDLTFASSTSG